MARRKSLLVQMYEAHQKAKVARERAEERARKEWLAEERRIAARLEKDETQRRREEERAAQARLREEQQAERARQQAAAKAERLAAQQERQRQQAQAQREEQRRAVEERRRAVERRIAEAEFRAEAVQRRVAELERLLQDRNRDLAADSRRVEEVFNAQGSEAFVAALQQVLATSVYPEGMHGSCAAMYRPEARELLVEYELPHQDVVPAVASYRYVKTKDVVQPDPRKDSEIKKLYEKLLARVTLRTLAEAFDVAPVALVDGIVFNGYVSAKDRATGKPVRPLVMSTHATREAFSEIVLDEPELDPKACLTGHLNAIISPNPFDLEPVARWCSSTCRSTSSWRRWTWWPGWTVGPICWRSSQWSSSI